MPYLQGSDKSGCWLLIKIFQGSNRNSFSFSKILKVTFYVNPEWKKKKKRGEGEFPLYLPNHRCVDPYTAKACISKMDLNIFRYICMFVLATIFLIRFSSTLLTYCFTIFPIFSFCVSYGLNF